MNRMRILYCNIVTVKNITRKLTAHLTVHNLQYHNIGHYIRLFSDLNQNNVGFLFNLFFFQKIV